MHLVNLERYNLERQKNTSLATVTQLIPGKKDIHRMVPAIVFVIAVVAVMGMLPGAGIALASFARYTLKIYLYSAKNPNPYKRHNQH